MTGNARYLPRRRFLHVAAGAAAQLVTLRIVLAQAYPSRPVHLIVGVAPGGAADTSARLIGQWLSERLAQPIVIENRPGAGGNTATEAIVNAPPDGHALLLVTPGNVVNSALYAKPNHDFIRDIAPVAGITRQGQIMLVNPSVPSKTVPDFIAYAKANPGKLNMASSGTGTTPHLAGELFKMMAGINLVHVPYRGGAAALTDLIGGQVQVMFLTPTASVEYVRAGKLRALAVTDTMRWEGLPDIPTVAESVPGYEAISWFGIGTTRGTSAEIIRKLNAETNAALADAKIKARLADLGGIPLVGSPEDFGRLITAETEKWAKVVKFAGIKAE
jgi:tripartite-type tricarboxylate transporter receptor subunit TctC